MNARMTLLVVVLAAAMGGLVAHKARMDRRRALQPVVPKPPPPVPGDETQRRADWDKAARQLAALLDPVLTALKEKRYETAHGLLHPELRSAWALDDFSRSVGRVRDEIGDRWAPSVRESFTGGGPEGPYCRCTYSLVEAPRAKYTLSLTVVAEGQGFIIVNFGLTCPSGERKEFDAATKAAREFVACLEREKYDDAMKLFRAKGRAHVSPAKLAQVRSVVWHKPGMVLEVSSDSCRKLSNGLWLDTIFFCSKDNPVSFFAVMIVEEDGAPMVASFDLNIRADGP